MNKKSLRLMIIIAACILVLCGCGKSKQAKEVDELIAAIGEVSLNSEKDIVSAEEYYDTLTEKQKNEVDNYKKLVDARKELNSLIEEKQKQEEEEKAKEEMVSFEKRLNEIALMQVKSQSDIDDITEKYKSFTEEQIQKYMADKQAFQKAIELTDYEKAAISAAQQLKSTLTNEDSLKLKSIHVAIGGKKTPGDYYVLLDYSASNEYGGMVDKTATIDVQKNFNSRFWKMGKDFSVLGANTNNNQADLELYFTYKNDCSDDLVIDSERIMNNIDVDVKNLPEKENT